LHPTHPSVHHSKKRLYSSTVQQHPEAMLIRYSKQVMSSCQAVLPNIQQESNMQHGGQHLQQHVYAGRLCIIQDVSYRTIHDADAIPRVTKQKHNSKLRESERERMYHPHMPATCRQAPLYSCAHPLAHLPSNKQHHLKHEACQVIKRQFFSFQNSLSPSVNLRPEPHNRSRTPKLQTGEPAYQHASLKRQEGLRSILARAHMNT
jgi:hypothetical protein